MGSSERLSPCSCQKNIITGFPRTCGFPFPLLDWLRGQKGQQFSQPLLFVGVILSNVCTERIFLYFFSTLLIVTSEDRNVRAIPKLCVFSERDVFRGRIRTDYVPSLTVSSPLSRSLDALKSPCPCGAGVRRPKGTWERRRAGRVCVCV